MDKYLNGLVSILSVFEFDFILQTKFQLLISEIYQQSSQKEDNDDDQMKDVSSSIFDFWSDINWCGCCGRNISSSNNQPTNNQTEP